MPRRIPRMILLVQVLALSSVTAWAAEEMKILPSTQKILPPTTLRPPPRLSDFRFNPASLACNNTTGTVTLSAPAPAGGVQVSLSVNDANVAWPHSVTIAEAATSAWFYVDLRPNRSTRRVTVSAALGDSRLQQQVSIDCEHGGGGGRMR